MRKIALIFLAITFASQGLAAELSESDREYCRYLELNAKYVEFIAAHPRIDQNDQLLSVPSWWLGREQELFMRGHRVWLKLVKDGYLPFSTPFLDPQCR